MNYDAQAVVYQIFNLKTCAFYVGSTVQLSKRWRTHRRKLNANKHHCPHLQNAWNKYGHENFELRVVQIVEDFTLLMDEEQKWLDRYHGKDECYNYARYVDSSARGIKFMPEHRKAISEGLKNFYKTNSAPSLGRQMSDEVKQKISAAKVGVKKTEAHKEKLRQANLGKKASAETKEKLSAIRKGKIKSPEWIAKYNKPIIEVSSGKVYASLKEVKQTYQMSPGQLSEALKKGGPMTRGRFAGLEFRYATLDSPTPLCYPAHTELQTQPAD